MIWTGKQKFMNKVKVTFTTEENDMKKSKWKCEVTQSCPILCTMDYPMDYSLTRSSIHEIFQARKLEWFAIFFSREIPDPGIKSRSLTLQAYSLPFEPAGNPMERWGSNKKSSLGEKSARDLIAWLFWISLCS